MEIHLWSVKLCGIHAAFIVACDDAIDQLIVLKNYVLP